MRLNNLTNHDNILKQPTQAAIPSGTINYEYMQRDWAMPPPPLTEHVNILLLSLNN